MHTLAELEKLTLIWSKERGIIDNGKTETQTLKLAEELGETIGCILKKKDLKDGIGDCMVVLCNMCGLSNVTLDYTLAITETTELPKKSANILYLVGVLGSLAACIIDEDTDLFIEAAGVFYRLLKILAIANDTTIEECWNLAYEEIKDRKGYLTSEGNFIKESDNV